MRNFKILSLDGGGTRGVIQLQILKKIEELTDKRIHEIFDLIVGTSTGGLISCGLTVSANGENPIYTIDELLDIYYKYGTLIFPKRGRWHKGKSLLRPLFSSQGLMEVLNKYFDDLRLSDCMKPIMVTSYNLLESRPVIFKSRDIYNGSDSYSHFKDARLVDVCRSTSAAPYFFGSHTFAHSNLMGTDIKRITCVDGGVYINNPAMQAYSEVVAHKSNPTYNCPEINKEDIYLLSIGTGHYINPHVVKGTEKWGGLKWGMTKSIIEVMMTGSSKIVHEQADSIINGNAFANNYLRLDVNFEDESLSQMTLTSKENLDKYKKVVESQIFNKNSLISEVKLFLDGMLEIEF